MGQLLMMLRAKYLVDARATTRFRAALQTIGNRAKIEEVLGYSGAKTNDHDSIPVLTKKDFQTDQEVRWCPGCGDYAILSAVQAVFPELGIPPRKVRRRIRNRLFEPLSRIT